jgi:threonine dehydrogenase-like Zn-dependent dehydrogenase
MIVQSTAAVLKLLDRAGDVRNKRVAVVGQGAYGILMASILKERGASHVTGIDVVDRSVAATELGIDHFLLESSHSWAARLPDSRRPDIVFEAVGHQQVTLADSINAVKDQGKVYFFGMADEDWYALPFGLMIQKGVGIQGGVVPVPERRAYLKSAQQYVLDHPSLSRVLVTHVLPYTQADEAFRLAQTPKAEQLKIVIKGEDR